MDIYLYIKRESERGRESEIEIKGDIYVCIYEDEYIAILDFTLH